jgi:hypothetical protein
VRLPAARTARALAVAATTALTIPLAAGTASAAGSAYGQWSPGALTVPVPGFPAAAFTTDGTGVSMPSGNSAFLGDSTPFGAAYGSSRGHNYLSLGAAPGGGPSSTTVTFHSPTRPGWGFALGDVDADTVQVTATGPGGVQLTADQLGWQSPFNYCDASPRPSSCTGGPFTDLPSWDAGSSTLIGGGSDTSGAAGWFRPTVPVVSLSLRFTVQTGSPVYQVWLAAPTAEISGRVTSGCGLPPGTTLELRNADGTPVQDESGGPLTTTAGADGAYSFPGVASGGYRVALRVPAGYTASGPASRAANPAGDDVTGVNFRLACRPVEQPPVDVPSGGGAVKIPVVSGADPGRPVDVTEPPEHGTVVLRGDEFSYLPEKGYAGTDSFIYRATLKDGHTELLKVSLKVAPKAQPAPPAGRPTHPAPPAPPVHPAPQHTGPQLAATGTSTDGLLLAAGLIGVGTVTTAASRAAARRRR